MRTAIFVYQTTTINIAINEDYLELHEMKTGSMTPLTRSGALQVTPGIYKIVSSNDVTVTGNVELITSGLIPNDKDRWPVPPPGITAAFQVDTTQIQTFFTVPLGKQLSPVMMNQL